MTTSRRDFVKTLAVGAAAAAAGTTPAAAASGPLLDDRVGVLTDLTLCVGCRKCEWACQRIHGHSGQSLAAFDDTSVFARRRRPDEGQLTVVNAHPRADRDKPTYVKVQCLHCEHPACASACLVGALQKNPGGPVTYDAQRCIGCRYCMVACPFQIPSYEYSRAFEPRVEKCSLCAQRVLTEDRLPACVEICPVEALLFGRRSRLLAIAHDRIRRHPERYIDHVYGEREVGGTSWLYLADRPFEELDLPSLPDESPAELTESIQHGIFKGFSGPLMLVALLAILAKTTEKEDKDG